MKRLKKMIVFSVMVMTVLSMSVVVAPQASAASAGDLIKMDGLSSVYYLGADGKRYVFPNESTYFSWYSDFSSVVTIAQSELESYPLGKNVTVRPGTKLVKITTNPNVYAVTPGGNLLLIPSEEVATALYGEAWASRVIDVADAFFTNYEIAAGEASATAYPAGSLVKFGGSDVYYIDADGKARLVVDEAAFEANRFSFDNVVESSLDMPTTGTDVTVKEDALSDTSEGAGGTANAGTGVSVALSSDTPASAIHPAGNTSYAAALVPFTVFNFTAANDGDVVIDRVMLTRTGLGDEAELGDVYLYDGMTRLTNGKSINSDDEVSFSGVDFAVPAGTTKALTVRVDLDGTGDSGSHAFAILNASDIETNGAVISGSFPLSGNAMALSATDVGALSYTLVNANATNITVGETDEDVLEIDLEELSGDEDVALHSIMFEQKGTISNSDLDNLALYDGATLLSDEPMIDGDFVKFELETPFIIEEGDTETLNLVADIDGGVGDTIIFEVDEVFDIYAIGQKYGYIAGVAGDNTGADTITIDGGELAIDEDDSNPSTQDVAKNTDNIVFLAAEFDAQDEPITITDLDVLVDFTWSNGAGSANEYVQNLTLYLDGELVAGPEDVTISTSSASDTITFEDEFTVTGVQVLTVEADITDDSANGTYYVEIDSANIVAEDSEGDAVAGADITGTATGNSVKVGLDAATIAKDSTLGNQDFVAGVDDFLVGRFIVEAGDSEGILITEYNVNVTVAGGTFAIGDVDDLYVDDSSVIASPDETDNAFAVNEELAAGESKIVSVFLTVDSGYTGAGTVAVSLSVTAEGLTSDDDVDLSAVTGQTMTLAQGTLALTVDASTPDADAVIGGASTKVWVGSFEFAAENLGYEITEMTVNAYTDAGTSTDNVAAVTGFSLDINGTLVDAQVNNGEATFDTSFRVEDDDETTVDIYATFNDINNTTATEKVQVGVSDYAFIADNESVEEEGVANNLYTALATGEVFEVYNTLLTVTSDRGSAGTTLINGENEMLEITFTADVADDVTIIAFTVDTSITTGGAGVIDAVRLIDSNDDVVASTSDGVFTGLTEDIGAGESKTYYIEVEVSSSVADDSVTAKLLETGFTWNDQEANRDGSLTEDLPGDTFEITK